MCPVRDGFVLCFPKLQGSTALEMIKNHHDVVVILLSDPCLLKFLVT